MDVNSNRSPSNKSLDASGGLRTSNFEFRNSNFEMLWIAPPGQLNRSALLFSENGSSPKFPGRLLNNRIGACGGLSFKLTQKRTTIVASHKHAPIITSNPSSPGS